MLSATQELEALQQRPLFEAFSSDLLAPGDIICWQTLVLPISAISLLSSDPCVDKSIERTPEWRRLHLLACVDLHRHTKFMQEVQAALVALLMYRRDHPDTGNIVVLSHSLASAEELLN